MNANDVEAFRRLKNSAHMKLRSLEDFGYTRDENSHTVVWGNPAKGDKLLYKVILIKHLIKCLVQSCKKFIQIFYKRDNK